MVHKLWCYWIVTLATIMCLRLKSSIFYMNKKVIYPNRFLNIFCLFKQDDVQVYSTKYKKKNHTMQRAWFFLMYWVKNRNFNLFDGITVICTVKLRYTIYVWLKFCVFPHFTISLETNWHIPKQPITKSMFLQIYFVCHFIKLQFLRYKWYSCHIISVSDLVVYPLW